MNYTHHTRGRASKNQASMRITGTSTHERSKHGTRIVGPSNSTIIQCWSRINATAMGQNQGITVIPINHKQVSPHLAWDIGQAPSQEELLIATGAEAPCLGQRSSSVTGRTAHSHRCRAPCLGQRSSSVTGRTAHSHRCRDTLLGTAVKLRHR